MDVLGLRLDVATERLRRAGWTEICTRRTLPPGRPERHPEGTLRVLRVRADENKGTVELVVAHER